MANDPIQEAYEDVYRNVDDDLTETAEGPSTVNVAPPKNKITPDDITPKVNDAEGEEDSDGEEEVPGVDLVKNSAPSVKEEKKDEDEEDADYDAGEEDEDDDEEDEDETKPPFESFDLDLDSIISESLKDKDDVSALINDESLSEDTKNNLVEVFNAAVRAKVSVIAEHIMKAAQNRLSEMNDHNNKEMTEQVDQYLDYVVSEWLDENKLAVNQGIRTEVTEDFMRGLRDLLNEHHVVVDEDRRDLIEELENKVETLEGKINDQMKKDMELRQNMVESECKAVFADVSSNLLDTQQEKLAQLAEGLEYDSTDQYREKLELLKKSYFSRKPKTFGSSNPEPESLREESTEVAMPASNDPNINSYLKHLNRQVKGNS